MKRYLQLSVFATSSVIVGLGIGSSLPLSADEIDSPPPFIVETTLPGDVTLPTFARFSEADSDLGVQVVLGSLEDYDPFSLQVSLGYLYTDNARVTEDDTVDDSVGTATLRLSYLPILHRNLYGEVTVQNVSFMYADNSDLDFNDLDAGAGLLYVLRSLGDTSLIARYNYTEYLDIFSGLDQPYQAHSAQVGAYKVWYFSSRQHAYISYLSDFAIDASPAFASRDEHAVTLAYRLLPMPAIRLEAYYRGAFLNFTEIDREDIAHTAGVAASWNFTRYFYATVHSSYTWNDSTALERDYEVFLLGARVGFNYEF